MSEELFWADQLADSIIKRKKFHYTDGNIKNPSTLTVKTSASLSGVLHIGRLSDTIRSESVYKALIDADQKAKLIWVAEDMDPFRKLPKGIPKKFEEYLGMAVTDMPDPHGCHKSYAEHFKEEYLEVVHDFVSTKLEIKSTREEYKKGSFKPYIKKILEHTKEIIEIQDKYRKDPLQNWSPWKPICENCGKLSTTHLTKFNEKEFHYECKDYSFESATAKGCNHKGVDDPLKGNGKLMWKSEWAAEWAMWKIVSEGAGKEYQVPGSAFWINGEICEKILNYPEPKPIFYEHLMIDNQKMSASLGNVVYPKEWVEVSSPEHLRLFYNKKVMKTRSFSWQDLPRIYDEFDKFARIYNGEEPVENKKEEAHIKRLFNISSLKSIKKPVPVAFSQLAMVAQVFPNEKDAINILEKTGHYNKDFAKEIKERFEKAKTWLDKYVPDEQKFTIQTELPKNLDLTDKQKEALHRVAEILKKGSYNEDSLYNEFYTICKDMELPPKDLFQAGYKVLLDKERGPKLASLILAIGVDKVISLFMTI
tara:strand:- start:1196 stop:2800 length:1605 start_codon:yes stop_codon:yes gene_type:complete